MSQGVECYSCLPKTAWPPTSIRHLNVNTVYSNPRCIFPSLAREFEFSSSYCRYDIRAANTTPAVTLIGLVDFYNQLPSYAALFYQVYRYARINAVNLSCELVATGSEPLIMAASVLPYYQAHSTALDVLQLATRPGAISKISGASAGTSRVIMSKTYKTAEELGQIEFAPDAWQTYADALNTTSMNVNHPYIAVGVDSINPVATWAGTIRIKATYHMQFFELQDLGLTDQVKITTKPDVRRQEPMDEESFSSRRSRR